MHLPKLRETNQPFALLKIFFSFWKMAALSNNFQQNLKSLCSYQEPFQRHASFFLATRILKMIANILNCESNLRWTNEYKNVSNDIACLYILILQILSPIIYWSWSQFIIHNKHMCDERKKLIHPRNTI